MANIFDIQTFRQMFRHSRSVQERSSCPRLWGWKNPFFIRGSSSSKQPRGDSLSAEKPGQLRPAQGTRPQGTDRGGWGAANSQRKWRLSRPFCSAQRRVSQGTLHRQKGNDPSTTAAPRTPAHQRVSEDTPTSITSLLCALGFACPPLTWYLG